MLTLVCLTLCAPLAIGEPRPEDQVELKNGKKLDGYVLLETDERLVLQVGSREQELEMKDVVNVRSAARTLATVFERLDSLPATEAMGRLDIARFCKANGLPGEAQVLALTALTLDPALAAAHEFLEHTKRASGWFVKRDSRTLPFEDLLESRKDFREPWKLRTTHFELATNVALRDAVAVATDLEREYRAFFGLFGRELGLYDVVEPMGIGVYSHSDSFPEGVTRNRAYFDPTTNQMMVNAENGLDRYAIFHEGVHALLHNTAERTRKGRGRIPGWLDEGLAEYVACSFSGDPGASKFGFGVEVPTHFVAHRTAEKPYDLARVLNFESGDFHASSKVDLKYAESYTLVHFSMHGENGKYRDGFIAFMRLAYEGKSSSSDFKDAIAVRERDFEKAWNVHVGRKP